MQYSSFNHYDLTGKSYATCGNMIPGFFDRQSTPLMNHENFKQVTVDYFIYAYANYLEVQFNTPEVISI